MTTPRTADEAYYAAKFTSPVHGTREGRKRQTPNRSYVQSAPGVTRRDDIYYAEPQAIVLPVQSPQIKSANLEVRHDNWAETLQTVRRLFEQGNATVSVHTSPLLAKQGQTAFDLSVGRGELTGEQVAAIHWRLVSPEVSSTAEIVSPQASPVVGSPALTSIVPAEAQPAATPQAVMPSKRRGRPKKSHSNVAEATTVTETHKPAIDSPDELDLPDEFDFVKNKPQVTADLSDTSSYFDSDIVEDVVDVFDVAATPADSDD